MRNEVVVEGDALAGTDGDVELLTRAPALGPLIARAALGSLMPGKTASSPSLPQRRVMLADQRVEPEQLAAFARVCGLTLRNELPATFIHVLTFPAQVHMMAAKDFPFSMVGMVHIANAMTLHRPVEITESVTLTSWAENLSGHPRGASVDLMGQARVGDEVVWEDRSTYLVRGATAGGATGGAENSAAEPTDAEPKDKVATETDTQGSTAMKTWALWDCPADLGRRYAAASGDVNPIHVNPLAAQVLGFPRAIAHGMWTHARALGAFEGRLGKRHTVEVSFRKPIVLPSRVAFRAAQTEAGYAFAVTNLGGDREHMTGTVSTAS